MADRESTFVIKLDGDDGTLTAVLNALKTRIRSDAREIERASQVELFKNAQAQAQAAADAFFATKKRVDDLRKAIEAIESAGGTVGKDLAKQLRDAEKAAAGATKEFERSKDALKQARADMRAAEVQTAALAAEQAKLAAAWTAQNDAATAAAAAAAAAVEGARRLAQEVTGIGRAFQANKDALGFKSLRDVQPEIDAVRRSYEQLRESGRLSFGEVSVAAARAQERIRELREDAVGIGQAFNQLRGATVAIAASLTGIGIAAFQAAQAYRAFAQQVAAVDSIAGVSRQRIDELAQGVRELARRTGLDAVEATKALYEIISSGIPAENSLTILEASARAAVAGLTSVDTAARVGVGVLNAYGLQVTDIGRVFDVLFKTVQDGVVNFTDLANNIGEVIPTARSAKVPLEEVGAAFVVLTRNGINAAEAATSIRSAIQNLSAPAPEAAERMRALGIELGNFSEVIAQLQKRDLSLSALREVVTDTRALKAVQILAQNFRLLRDEIGEMNAAAGATEAAYAKLADTPQARVDRFAAAVKDLGLSFGEFVTNATGFVQTITGIVNGFNSLDASTRRTAVEVAALAAAWAGFAVILRQLAVPLNLFVGSLLQAIPGLAKFKGGIDAATLALRALNLALVGFLAFELGKWARENVPFVSSLGDALGTLLGAVGQSAGLAFDGLTAALTLNGRALGETRDRALRFGEYMRDEFREIMSGARERIRELTRTQEALREEFGKAQSAATAAATGVATAVAGIASNARSLLAGVEQQIQQFEQRLTSLVARLGESVTATQQLAQQGVGEVNARVTAQLAALERLRLGEVAKVREVTEIQRQAAAERLAILNRFAGDAIKAFEAEARAKLEIARRNGADLQRIDAEINAARRSLLGGVLDQFRAHLGALLTMEQQHLANVKKLEEQRRDFNASIEDKIRELRRANLNAYEQYADRVKQIDELLSKARLALLKGEGDQAEKLAQRAIGLVDQISEKVEDGGRTIVSQYEAQRTGIARLQEAQRIYNASLAQRERAEKEGAEAARAAADQTAAKIADLAKQVERLQDVAEKGVEVRIAADTTALDEALAKLDSATAERERILRIQADVTAAEVEIARLKADLEKGITVNVDARTDEIDAALRRIEEAEPAFSVNVDPALAELAKVKTAAKELENVRMRITSNAAEVQREIDNLKKPTESVHTIRIRRVEENAAGGVVGEGLQAGVPVQRFARGGGVFRRPAWSKVPGVGNEDTVPAALKAGSFVIRKSASRYYGDGLLDALKTPVQRFAVGGIAKRLLGGSFSRRGGQDIGGDIAGDSLAAIIAQAYRVIQPLIDAAKTLKRSRTGQNLADYLQNVLDLVVNATNKEDARTIVERLRAEFDNLLASIATAARMRVPIVMGASVAGEDTLSTPRRFAAGGAAVDSVPALLTPGEHVIKPAAVRNYGTAFLEAINSMRIPRSMLADMVAPPRVHRFEQGGEVPGAVMPRGQMIAGSGSGNVSVTINANAGDILSEENVRRFIVPVFENLQRRTRT